MKTGTYAPIEEMKPYVRMFWVLNVDEQVHHVSLKRIPTTGNPKIVVSVHAEPLVLKMAKPLIFPQRYNGIDEGQQISTTIVDCPKNARAIGVELCPIRKYRMLGHAMNYIL